MSEAERPDSGAEPDMKAVLDAAISLLPAEQREAIELAVGANGNVKGVLERLPGVGEVKIEGRTLHARVERGATAVPAVLAALEAERVPVASVTVARPSLDDVYLRYAGRAFRAAEEKETAR